MTASITVNGRLVGSGNTTYIVAEMSANHGQRFERAVAIIEAAKEAGADAVKLQTYTADTITIDCDKEFFKIGEGSLWAGRMLHDLYREAYTPWEWQPKLNEVANGLGMDLFSSPFDQTAVDFLQLMGVPVYKVASPEVIDTPLVEKIARMGRPMIISTGMATTEEIEETLRAARGAGATEIALLKCTSAYPAPPEEMNLRAIPYLAERFGVPVGLSDHTLGIAVPVAGVALGACIVEKHLTLRRADGGPDAAFSLEPGEFKAMVQAVRVAERALGEARLGCTDSEAASRLFRRSLFVVRDVRKGELLTSENVRAIRPAHGLAPKHLDEVLGRHAEVDIERGTPLEWKHVSHN